MNPQISDLLKTGRTLLPVAPAQPAETFPARNPDGSAKVDKVGNAIPAFTGKNPSYLDGNQRPVLVNHHRYQSATPTPEEINNWFANPANGIGELCGVASDDNAGIHWIDWDAKNFDDRDAMEVSFQLWISSHPSLADAPIEVTPSGGYHVMIVMATKPAFTNFALIPGGSHVGEVLGQGRFCVIAPTVTAKGVYSVYREGTPPLIEDLSHIGIHSVKKPASLTKIDSPINLADLLCPTAKSVLDGTYDGDRSGAITTLYREACGWENFTQINSIPLVGDAITLAFAGAEKIYGDGFDEAHIDRIIDSVKDADSCRPACVAVGGVEAAIKLINRINNRRNMTMPLGMITPEITAKLNGDQETSQQTNQRTGQGSGQRNNQLSHQQTSSDLPPITQIVYDEDVSAIATEQSQRTALNIGKVLSPELATIILRNADLSNISAEHIVGFLLPCVAGRMGRGMGAINGYRVSSNIWSVVVGKTSSRKSGALTPIAKPLTDLEAESRKAHAKALRQYNKAMRDIERGEQAPQFTATNAMFVASGPTPVETDDADEDLERPIRLPVVVNNASSEALQQALTRADRHEQALVAIGDEINTFMGSTLGYGKSGEMNRAMLLSAFDGGAIFTDRVDESKDIYSASSRLCVAVGGQPDVVSKLLLTGNHDGLAARFLMFHDPFVAKYERVKTKAEQALQNMELIDEVTALYTWINANKSRWVSVDSTHEADVVFVDYCNYWHDCISRATNERLKGIIGKANAYLVKVSQVLHAIECYYNRDKDSREIDAQTVARAFDIVEYSLNNWRREIDEERETDDVSAKTILKRCIDFLVTNGGSASIGELQNKVSGMKKFIKSSREINPDHKPDQIITALIESLQQANRIATVDVSGRGYRVRLAEGSSDAIKALGIAKTIEAPQHSAEFIRPVIEAADGFSVGELVTLVEPASDTNNEDGSDEYIGGIDCYVTVDGAEPIATTLPTGTTATVVSFTETGEGFHTATVQVNDLSADKLTAIGATSESIVTTTLWSMSLKPLQ